jgi:predicted DNA-binding protein (MmcQ/YjbR family)
MPPPKAKPAKSHDSVRRRLKAFGLAYPEAHSKSPWPGHDDLAVRGKTFAYLNEAGEPLSLSVKLPLTGKMVLTLPNAQPTGYGLGKSGWVSVTFATRDKPDLELLKAWVDESYRAQAPKKLSAQVPPPKRNNT